MADIPLRWKRYGWPSGQWGLGEDSASPPHATVLARS